MKTNERTELTIQDIQNGYENDAWQGFGFLGERRNYRFSYDPEAVCDEARADHIDAAVLYIANQHGWTADRLFTWMNSKAGRIFGDMTFGGDDDPLVAAKATMLR